MVLSLLTYAALASARFGGQAQLPPLEDPSAPLRRFPVSFMVHRQGEDPNGVSLLRLPALHPNDEIEVKVADRLTRDWTLVAAFMTAGRKPKVQSWNLWDKKYNKKSARIGKLPDDSGVPMFFLVLNRKRDGRAGAAIKKALETSSEQIVNATASFVQTYEQQDRMLCLINAYSSLGVKESEDPEILRQRLTRLGSDLGVEIDPKLRTTKPADLRRGLSAGIGMLTQLRRAPDDPVAAAKIVQSQLPGPIAEWVGLAADLVHLIIRPRRELKMTLVPASAAEHGPEDSDAYMNLVTERVLETKDDSVPALMYRPTFERTETLKPISLAFERATVLSSGTDVAIPLSSVSRDLFIRPQAWDWKVGLDGQAPLPAPGAQLVAGRGLVIPTNETWWGGKTERQVTISARVSGQNVTLPPIRVAKVFPQQWTTKPSVDVAAGDGAAQVALDRTGGSAQPFYYFASATLIDSAGRAIPASGTRFDGSLVATFNLAGAAPGPATVRVQQEEAASPDTSTPVFIAPKRPSVGFICASKDTVIRAVGPDSRYVQTIAVPEVKVVKTDDSVPGERSFVLSAPLPANVSAVDATYQDPGQSNLVWKRTEGLTVGAPRPKFVATLIGSLPEEIQIGSGADPSWAVAKMPKGYFRTKQPIRLQLSAVPPFGWAHDLSLDLGFGPATDVQKITSLTEGPSFLIDTSNPKAVLTMTLDAILPQNPRRAAGVLWFRATRADLTGEWTVVTLPESQEGLPLRSIRLPMVSSVENNEERARITFGQADDVVAVKVGDKTLTPTLLESGSNGLSAYVDAPAGTTEFDLVMRDATDGVVHVKISKPATPTS